MQHYEVTLGVQVQFFDITMDQRIACSTWFIISVKSGYSKKKCCKSVPTHEKLLEYENYKSNLGFFVCLINKEHKKISPFLSLLLH